MTILTRDLVGPSVQFVRKRYWLGRRMSSEPERSEIENSEEDVESNEYCSKSSRHHFRG